MPLGRLHVVTDARAGRRPLEVVGAALRAGAPVVQVRAKACTDRELFDVATRVAALCAEHRATCLVDDRADVAVAVGADGVHVGEHDLPVDAVRRVLAGGGAAGGIGGIGGIVGGTAREPVLAKELVAAGASYLGVGPAFVTSTKQGLPAPIGVAGVGAVASAVDVPVIAIGGITAAQVPELLAAGVHGVAVVSAIADAADPEAATRTLLAALDGAASRPGGEW